MDTNQAVAEQVIHRSVWNPTDSVFKSKANERATCTTIWCRLESCPIRDAGGCTWVPVIGWDKCPYGRCRTEEGPTKRARSCRKWCQDRENEFSGAGRLGYPARKLAFVGEYVYLPYAHMNMNKAVPFLQHSSLFIKGNAFLPQKWWTIATVLSLIDFSPRAMTGGVIDSYQQEEVPKFLAHLREMDSAMWSELIAERPGLDVPPEYIGRTALLRTLNAPIEWSTRHPKYTVQWRWDGRSVTTSSEAVYSKTWGELWLESFVLSGAPSETATVIVRDNAWVNDDTVFTD